MTRSIRMFAALIANGLIAIFGTAVVELPLAGMFHPRTLFEYVAKTWVLNVIVAARWALSCAIPGRVQRSRLHGFPRWHLC